VGMLSKLLNHSILFFENAHKSHDIKSFEAFSKELFEKVKVTPPPPESRKKINEGVFYPHINNTLKKTYKNHCTFLYTPRIYSHSDILISKIKVNAKEYFKTADSPKSYLYKNYQLKIAKCLCGLGNDKSINC
jgi:hypothetical protein